MMIKNGSGQTSRLEKRRFTTGIRKVASVGLAGLMVSATPLAITATALLASTALTPAAVAQDRTTGEVLGTVSDASGAAIAGVTVTLTDATRGFSATSVSDSNGHFAFRRLSIATYTATVVDADGTEIQNTLRVNAGSVRNLDFIVAGGSALETVTVTASRAILTRKDFHGQETGITIDTDDLIKRVPVARDVTSIALLAPGTAAADSTFVGASGGGLASIGGSSGAENTILVNGYNTTDPRRFLGSMNAVPFEFFQQVDVKSGGYQAEFGRTTGGVMNMVTKSGTNEFGGGVAVYHTPDFFRGKDPDTDNVFSTLDTNDVTSTNVWLSGPLIEDRLFFYSLIEYTDSKQTNFGNTTVAENNNDRTRWGVNIDGVLVDNDELGRHSFTYTHIEDGRQTTSDQFNYDRDTNVRGDARGSGFFNGGGNTDIINYKGVIRDWLTVSFLYGESEADNSQGSTSDDQPVIFDARSGSFLARGNWVNFTVLPIDNDSRQIYRGDVDIFVNDMMGDHAFRVGFDVENLTAAEQSANSGGVYYAYFNTGPDTRFAQTVGAEGVVRKRTRTTGGSFQTKHSAIYIQDRWSVTDQLTLNIGLRNETFDNKNVLGESFVKLSSQFDYRLGFTYDINGDQSSRVYGFAGRYHLPVANNTNVRMAGEEFFIHDWFHLDAINADDTPVIGEFLGQDVVSPGGVQPARTLVDKDLRSQKQDEYFLGYEVDAFDDWTFGIRATYRELSTGIEDGAIDVGIQNWATANGLDASHIEYIWSAFHQFVLINPGDDVTVDLDVGDFSIGSFNPRTDLLTDDDNVVIETAAEMAAVNAANLAHHLDVQSTFDSALGLLGGDADGDGFVEITLTGDQMARPQLERTYKAIELTANKAFSDGWSFSASYTLSKSEGNYEGSIKSDVGQTDSGLTQDFDSPGLTDNTNGLLPNNKTHVIKAFGSYQVTDNLTLGANVLLQSGRSFACLGIHPNEFAASLFGVASFFCDLDGDGVKEATPRGTVTKLGWNKRVDISAVLTPEFSIFDGANVSLRLDVFNVFNSHDVTDIVEQGELPSGAVNPNFGDPSLGGYVAPRSVRLSARAAF